MPLFEYLKSRYKPGNEETFKNTFDKVFPDKSSHPAFVEIPISELVCALNLAGLAIGLKVIIINNKHDLGM